MYVECVFVNMSKGAGIYEVRMRDWCTCRVCRESVWHVCVCWIYIHAECMIVVHLLCVSVPCVYGGLSVCWNMCSFALMTVGIFERGSMEQRL